MALHGDLSEIDLANILQLLALQQQSGTLELVTRGKQGGMVLHDGMIALAWDGVRDVSQILLTYLANRHTPNPKTLNDWTRLAREGHEVLAAEALRVRLINREDWTALAKQSLQDLVCELFDWREGTYRFRPHDPSDDLLAGGVVLPVEAVTLEAMRRQDETPSLRVDVPDEAVFRPVHGSRDVVGGDVDPLRHPAKHILQILDSEKSVRALQRQTCLSEFHLRQVLRHLKSRGLIVAERNDLPDPSTLHESGDLLTVSMRRHVLLPSLALIFVILGLLALLPGLLLRESDPQKRRWQDPVQAEALRQKTSTASILFAWEEGRNPQSADELYRAGLLDHDEAQVDPSQSR